MAKQDKRSDNIKGPDFNQNVEAGGLNKGEQLKHGGQFNRSHELKRGTGKSQDYQLGGDSGYSASSTGTVGSYGQSSGSGTYQGDIEGGTDVSRGGGFGQAGLMGQNRNPDTHQSGQSGNYGGQPRNTGGMEGANPEADLNKGKFGGAGYGQQSGGMGRDQEMGYGRDTGYAEGVSGTISEDTFGRDRTSSGHFGGDAGRAAAPRDDADLRFDKKQKKSLK